MSNNKTVIYHLAINILESVVYDNNSIPTKGYKELYSDKDLYDLIAQLHSLKTSISLFTPILSHFPHFTSGQLDSVIDFICFPEESDLEEFLQKHPEFKGICEILNRPF